MPVVAGLASLSGAPALTAAADTPDGLWAVYQAAYQAALVKAEQWRMMRQAGGSDQSAGLLFGAAYEAQNAADKAYENWRAAQASAFPGARGLPAAIPAPEGVTSTRFPGGFMRLLLSCNGCHASAAVTCSCPPGPSGHKVGCLAADLDAALACPPGSGCCEQDHHHGQAANACPGAGLQHGEAACPHPAPALCTVVTPAGEPCPGGHCGKGVPGCTVCRPLTVTIIDLGIPVG